MSYYYFISGTVFPDIVGRYEESGINNSKPYYTYLVSGPPPTLFYLFWNNTHSNWAIHSALSEAQTPVWLRNGSGIEGDYLPDFPATGIATVTQIDPEVIRPFAESQLILTGEASLNFVPDQIHFDWVRWCYASINKYFDDKKEQYELYIEGDERTQQDEAEFAELRIDGPFITIPQKNFYILDVEINILCQTHLDPRQHYQAQKMIGVFTRVFRNLIPVYRYGDGPLDDGSLLECFHLSKNLRDGIAINHFGIIRSDTKIMQTTIEGHYRLELWTKGD